MILVSPALSRPSVSPSRRAGFSLLEVCVVAVIMLLATSMFCQTVLSTNSMRIVTHENRTAARAARTVLECMRADDFEDVFILYNADPKDDPDGEWTAPGHLFDVRGLRPVADAAHPHVGEIIFPARMAVSEKAKSAKDLEKESEKKAKVREGGVTRGGVAFPGPAESERWWLREDFEDKSLGMPRDLSGDYLIDDEDHGEDYVRLPVCVRVTWQGPSGPRVFEVHSILADYMHRDKKLEEAHEKARKAAEKEEKKAKEEEKKAKKKDK